MCGTCIDLILFSTSCFKVNAQDIHFEKIPVSISIKLPSIQKKYGQLSKVGPVHYISGLQRQILCSMLNTFTLWRYRCIVYIILHHIPRNTDRASLILILNYRIYSKKPELYRKVGPAHNVSSLLWLNIDTFTLPRYSLVLYWYLIVAYNWAVTWDFQQSGMCYPQSPRSACTYAQSDHSLC